MNLGHQHQLISSVLTVLVVPFPLKEKKVKVTATVAFYQCSLIISN
jgi:hypothetical protein